MTRQTPKALVDCYFAAQIRMQCIIWRAKRWTTARRRSCLKRWMNRRR